MTTSTVTVQNFTAKVKSISTLGLKANLLAHTLGVFAMSHAEKTGDFRQVGQVYDAMKAGHLRAEAFKGWVGMFSPIRWNADGKMNKAKEGSKGYRAFDCDKAEANPFWTIDALKERVLKDLSIEVLQKLINAALKRVDDVQDDGFVYDKEGNAAYQAKGNVVALRSYAASLRQAIATVKAPATASVEDVATIAAQAIAA